MKSFILSIVIICFSALTLQAQPMLQGSPSLNNFIGSPGMWMVAGAVFLIVLLFVVLNKKQKSDFQ